MQLGPLRRQRQPPDLIFLDIPALLDIDAAHQPPVAASARPWPGNVALYASTGTEGFDLITLLPCQTRMGRLLTALPPGLLGRWDHGPICDIALDHGKLTSLTDLDLFAGANLLTVQGPAGWELLQAREATLIGPTPHATYTATQQVSMSAGLGTVARRTMGVG